MPNPNALLRDLKFIAIFRPGLRFPKVFEAYIQVPIPRAKRGGSFVLF